MKKLLAFIMTACLTATMILPVAASDAALETRLANVTIATKKLLGIGDEYTDFSGQLREGTPTNCWDLYWKNETSRIDVRMTEGGKLVQYSIEYEQKAQYTPRGELKKFPKLTKSQAKQIAQDFLAKVLDTPLESSELQETSNLIRINYDNSDYYFYGNLKLNGKKTPIRINLCVDSAKKMVTSFNRHDEGIDYRSYPMNAKVSKESANATLYKPVKMQLNYVVSEQDSKHAILQYTPEQAEVKVVDALTGELLPKYYEIFYGATKDAAAGNGGLSNAERNAIKDLKGFLSAKDLEAKARAISELSIGSDFKLISTNYYTEKKDKATEAYAVLSFEEPASDTQPYAEKEILLNAKTGAFFSVNTYLKTEQNVNARYDRAQCENIARAFAGKFHAEELKLTALAKAPEIQPEIEKRERFQTFSFVRQVNGIAFPNNEITVSVDKVDGSIGNYSISWDKEMTFASAKNIKTEQEAKAIYTKAVGLALCYENVSTDKLGLQSELKLVYAYDNPNVWGVDPVTGKPLTHLEEQNPSIAYSDITGHFAQKQIETLAEYKIGYLGGAFQPDQKLTQKDALCLIVLACGFSPDQNNKDYEDNLYSDAYTIGLLSKSERNPSAPITRAALTKLLVTAAGYSEVAQLKDIYRIGFKDEKEISKDLFGYVAIAKGLGMIQGNANGSFNPNGVATRAQLAIMLYNILNR